MFVDVRPSAVDVNGRKDPPKETHSTARVAMECMLKFVVQMFSSKRGIELGPAVE